MKKEDCIFCKLANGDIPTNSVYEDDDYKAILDMGPATKGHTIILPKNHADNLFELSDDDAQKVMMVAKKVATKLTDKLGAEGVNLVQNNGEVAGQTVMHFHLHVIPRYSDDNQKISWNPTEPSAEELKALCEKINA